MVPSGTGTMSGHAFVPVDDANTMCWNITWNPMKPLEERRSGQFSGFAKSDGGLKPDSTDWLGRWRQVADASNDYFMDYEAQKYQRYSGIVSINLQDSGLQESMGAIIDRPHEHLGQTDMMIIQMRRLLVKRARELQQTGQVPPEIDNPKLMHLRSLEMILPEGADWIGVGGPWMFGDADAPPAEGAKVTQPPPRGVNDPLRETALYIKEPLPIKSAIEAR
jgi:hypothetical protein